MEKYVVEQDMKKQVGECLWLAHQCKEIDGAHHKDWLIDQIVRCLTGDKYDDFVRNARYPYGEDDEANTYDWCVGIPP